MIVNAIHYLHSIYVIQDILLYYKRLLITDIQVCYIDLFSGEEVFFLVGEGGCSFVLSYLPSILGMYCEREKYYDY